MLGQYAISEAAIASSSYKLDTTNVIAEFLSSTDNQSVDFVSDLFESVSLVDINDSFISPKIYADLTEDSILDDVYDSVIIHYVDVTESVLIDDSFTGSSETHYFESAALIDNFTSFTYRIASTTESKLLTDSSNSFITFNLVGDVNESLVINDRFASINVSIEDLTESLALNDSSDSFITPIIVGDLTEDIIAVDSVDSITEYKADVNESGTLSDNVDSIISPKIFVDVTEPVSLDDSVDSFISPKIFVDVNESGTLSDNYYSFTSPKIYADKSESASLSDSYDSFVSPKIYGDLTESALLSDSNDSTTGFGVELIESASLYDNLASFVEFYSDLTESGALSDNYYSFKAPVKNADKSESASLSDSYDSFVSPKIYGDLTESALLSDSNDSLLIPVSYISESVILSDNFDSINEYGVDAVESVALSDSYDSFVSPKIYGDVTESLALDDSYDFNVSTSLFTITEESSNVVEDSSDASVNKLSKITESIVSIDLPSANYFIFSNISEIVHLNSYEGQGNLISGSLVENELASDSPESALIAMISEAITVSDSPNATYIALSQISESGSANDFSIRNKASFSNYADYAVATESSNHTYKTFAITLEFASASESLSLGSNTYNTIQIDTTIATDFSNTILFTYASVSENATAKDLNKYIKSSVSFNDPFNSVYSDYSYKISNVVIPSYFVRYEVDKTIDPSCLAVFAASPSHGATAWSRFGRWITIGMYHDTGRNPSNSKYFTTTWTRNSSNLIINITDTNGIQVGDFVDVLNSNVQRIIRAKVIEVASTSFTVKTEDIGNVSGTGHYRYNNYQFAERRVVFKLIPNNKVITIAELNEIFEYCKPIPNRNQDQYGKLSLSRRFSQIYDQFGEPLNIKYNDQGTPVVDKVIAGTHRQEMFINSPVISESDDNNLLDSKVYVYDTYGIDINDQLRAPYYAKDIISRDPQVNGNVNNILRKLDNQGNIIYNGPLFDVFGNKVVGIMPNNTVVLEEPSLPITVDRFNKPIGKSFRIERQFPF